MSEKNADKRTVHTDALETLGSIIGSNEKRERRAKAIKDGNCTDCFKVKSMAGKTTCRDCQDTRNARTMKSYYAKKAA